MSGASSVCGSAHRLAESGIIGSIEKDVPVTSDVEAIPDSDYDSSAGRSVSSCDLRPEVGGLLANGAPGYLRGNRIGEQGSVYDSWRSRTPRRRARQNREADQSSVVAVHFIAEPREAVSVLADLPERSKDEPSG